MTYFFGEAKGDRINYLNDINKLKIKKILINNKNKKIIINLINYK